MRLRALYDVSHPYKRFGGFTFLEVTLLIAIILVIGVTSTWFTMQFLFQQQTVIAAQLMRAQLSQVSLYAESGKAFSDWGVSIKNDSIIIFAGPSYEERNAIFDQSVILPRGVTITGPSEIVFTRLSGETSQSNITISGNSEEIRYAINRFGILTKL